MKDVKWKGEEVSCNTDAYAHLELIEDGDDVDSVRLEMHMPGSWLAQPTHKCKFLDNPLHVIYKHLKMYSRDSVGIKQTQ